MTQIMQAVPVPDMKTANLKAPVRIPRQLERLDDIVVVKASLAGSVAAEYELYERYRHRIGRHIWNMIHDPERTEDLVQETFFKVFRYLATFNMENKFSTWIYTIAGNLAKNELRDRGRSPLIYYYRMPVLTNEDGDEMEMQFEDTKRDTEREVSNRYMRERIDWAVAQLKPHHRQVFTLRDLEGKSYEEICQITGTTLGTVKSQLNRARTAFAAIIGPYVN